MARRLFAAALDDMVEGIEQARIQIQQGQSLKGATGWGIPFLVMDPGVLALATLSGLLDYSAMRRDGSPFSAIQAVNNLGDRAEQEWHFALLRDEAPKLKAVLDRRVKTWNRRTMYRARKAMGDLGKPWPAKAKRLTGAKLLEIAVKHSGIFTIRHWRAGVKERCTVHLTDEAADSLHELTEETAILRPVCQPMLTPPDPWASGERGGYRLLKPYYPMVIPRGDQPVADDHGPDVYEALNVVQRTEWRINAPVLDTMRRVWEAGGGWAGLPHAVNEVMSEPFPVDGTEAEKTAWKFRASHVHRRNARAMQKRLVLLYTLMQAGELCDRVFYFPHRFDFRGRLYPMSGHLHPQSNDMARGLLRFHEAKPLGERGWWWLRVQFANCWGVDKVSFAERVAWTDRKLVELAARQPPGIDPFEVKDLWAGADDPWQALACLLEMDAATSYPGGAHAYPSTLPVSIDGSNSGLQHFSAMLRDPHGAQLVNLAPSAQPSDVYLVVADDVRRAVESDAKGALVPDTTIDDLPRQWLEQGIDRKLCKRPTMTYCYGVTQRGLMDALVADGFVDWAENQHAAVTYIGRKVWAAIRENVQAAADAMDWLRGVASVANQHGLLLEWSTPDGFRVRHPYLVPSVTTVKCMNMTLRAAVTGEDPSVRAHVQRNALPPTFLHSLDATHLRMTAVAGAVHGITSWMMIHDSFGTHAADVDELAVTLREQFIKLYTIDVLDRLRQQVTELTGEDPGPPPEMGDFDLELVRDAQYIFS